MTMNRQHHRRLVWGLACCLLSGWGMAGWAQKLLLRDDFFNKKQYWYWRNDGPVDPPQLKSGLVSANLVNPTNQTYCNVELMNPNNIFDNSAGPITVRMRVKAMQPKKPGTWGWGLWHSEDTDNKFVFDMAWFMEQRDSIADSYNTWWRAISGDKSMGLLGLDFMDLDSLVDQTRWHTYTVLWHPDSVVWWVDDARVYKSTTVIPKLKMAFHFWVDNNVHDMITAAKTPQAWQGENELVMDYVEIYRGEFPQRVESPGKNVVFRGVYNEIGPGQREYLWKDIPFTSRDGETVILVTGRAEQYGRYSDDDDVRLVLDQDDWGWNTARSLDGERLNGAVGTIVHRSRLAPGEHRLQIWGDVTPTLYDVTILSAPGGAVVLLDTLVETAPDLQNHLWKRYSFTVDSGWVSLFVAGAADEDRTGNDYSDAEDDDLMVQLDSLSFGWQTDTSLYGNQLFGEGKTLLIQRWLPAGTHQLLLWSNGTPTKTSVLVYASSRPDSTPLGINSNGQPIQRAFLLKPNYPNPFNQSTRLEWELFRAQRVYLRIVDIQGRELRVLINGRLPAGRHVLEWDGTDRLGNALPSGLYFAVLSAGTQQQIQKVLLLR